MKLKLHHIKLLISLFFISLTTFAFSQSYNWVVNSTFEDLYLPVFKGNIAGQGLESIRDTSLFWKYANKKRALVTPSYVSGVFYYSDTIPTVSGRVFGEMCFYLAGKKRTNESNVYSTLALRRCLIGGAMYELSFYLKPFSLNVLWDEIEVAFTKDENIVCDTLHAGINIADGDLREDLKYSILQDTVLPIPQGGQDSFIHISYRFYAKGGEQFIHLGNIRSLYPTKLNVVNPIGIKYTGPKNKFYSYYIFDDVSLVCLSCNSVPVVSDLPDFDLNKIGYMTIYFPVNAKETAVDFTSLSNFLENYPSAKFKLKIVGYTDISGSTELNHVLAIQRAEFIKEKVLDISNYRIEIVNGGILPGDDDYTRTLNRRVVIETIKE